jgi:hypothetical protein
MRRATLNGADLITQGLQSGGYRYRCAMLTLTYAQDDQWQPRHLSDLVHHIRRWMARRGHTLRQEWVAELTARGRLHYHLCLWLPQGLTLPKPDKQGWWTHGTTRIEWARRPIAYMAKYASKATSGYLDENYLPHQFPKGARIHGRCGLDAAQRRAVAWWCLPRYVRQAFPEVGTVVVRARGGGWISPTSGEWLAPWCLPPPEWRAGLVGATSQAD